MYEEYVCLKMMVFALVSLKIISLFKLVNAILLNAPEHKQNWTVMGNSKQTWTETEIESK